MADNNNTETNSIQYMKGCIDIPIPDDVLAEAVTNAKDFALLHGAGMRYRDNYDPDVLPMAPFFLLPSSFPRRDFEMVTKLQPTINKLMHNIAHDHEFLKNALSGTVNVDSFTARLWHIYTTVREEGVTQEVSLGLLRSDLMMTECQPGCCELCITPPFVCQQQVECNTIASGFGHMGPVSADIHKYVLQGLKRPELLSHLPKNPALEELCAGMLLAWKIYDRPKSVILFVVEDVTYNICDQRFHEYEIRRQRPDVQVIRRNLTEISNRGSLTDHKRLIIDGEEIAVVYFRAGYEPSQYPTEGEWEARLNIERSMAIKCPSIHYHLAGTKKVQQEIAQAGVLDRFLSTEEAKKVASIFTGLYTLDMGPDGDKAVSLALNNPTKYVLKPQREGGGNNFYGDDLKKILNNIKDSHDREAYILMDRISPPIQKNYLVRPYKPTILADVVSELGIFGVIVGSSDRLLENKYAGHMLRTKLSDLNEGGVAAGHGALDSVFLFD